MQFQAPVSNKAGFAKPGLWLKAAFGIVVLYSITGFTTPASTQTEPALHKTAGASAAPGTEELTLEKLQDCGVLLHHIRQQAINIYREASRVPLSPHRGPKIQEVRSIPYESQNKQFLPARTRWLVYFFANIEPVVRDLAKQVNDVRSGSGALVVPDDLKKKMCPLCDQWIEDTQRLNHHLDELLPLFDDAAHNNLKIQDLAVAIFDDAKQMEMVREQVYKIVRDNQKSGNDKVMLAPALWLNHPETGK